MVHLSCIAHEHEDLIYCLGRREREKQRLQELSTTLQDLSLRMQEQAIEDAETELLEKESEHLQQLSRELDAELAALQNNASSSSNKLTSRADSPSSPLPTQSSGETSQGSLQSSTIPCNIAGAGQQHHTMYEAYEYVVCAAQHSDLHTLLWSQWGIHSFANSVPYACADHLSPPPSLPHVPPCSMLICHFLIRSRMMLTKTCRSKRSRSS